MQMTIAHIGRMTGYAPRVLRIVFLKQILQIKIKSVPHY